MGHDGYLIVTGRHNEMSAYVARSDGPKADMPDITARISRSLRELGTVIEEHPNHPFVKTGSGGLIRDIYPDEIAEMVDYYAAEEGMSKVELPQKPTLLIRLNPRAKTVDMTSYTARFLSDEVRNALGLLLVKGYDVRTQRADAREIPEAAARIVALIDQTNLR